MFMSCFCRSQAYSAAPLRNFQKFRRRVTSSNVQDAKPALENAPTPHVQRPPTAPDVDGPFRPDGRIPPLADTIEMR